MQTQQTQHGLGANQLDWCCKNLAGFAKYYAEAQRARQDAQQIPHPEKLEENEKAR